MYVLASNGSQSDFVSLVRGCSSTKMSRNESPPPPPGGCMQVPLADKVRVDHAPTAAPSSFFLDEARNESVRRTTWDKAWSSMGLISSTYLTSVAALSAKHETIFEHNLGTPLV